MLYNVESRKMDGGINQIYETEPGCRALTVKTFPRGYVLVEVYSGEEFCHQRFVTSRVRTTLDEAVAFLSLYLQEDVHIDQSGVKRSGGSRNKLSYRAA